MSNSGDVAQLYKNTIEEVIKKVRNDFVNMGVDEQVLADLQSLWEQKLIDAHVFNPQDFPITATRDYSQTAGFFYPAPGVAKPYASAATMPLQTNYPLPYPVPYYAPQRPVLSASMQIPGAATGIRSLPRTGPESEPFVPPQQQQQQQQQQQVKKDPYELDGDDIPQFDGADEPALDPRRPEGTLPPFECMVTVGDSPGARNNVASQLQLQIPQYDGADDDSAGSDDTNNNNNNASASEEATVGPSESTLAKRSREDDADELNSDLDDDDEEDLVVEDDAADDMAVCQYEKINRVRTRWRGVLRAGIIHIGNSDYCFSRANIDLDW